MPQIYRRHSEYTPRPPPEPRRQSSGGLDLTDVDESIVISDILRTGEASRLRRRGAMRLDHSSAGALRSNAVPPPVAVAVPARDLIPMALPSSPARPTTPPWASGDPLGEGEAYRNGWQDYSTEEYPSGPAADDERRRSGDNDDHEESFVLYCGGEETRTPRKDYSEPFRPSVLPITPSEHSAKHSSRKASASRRTTGCGATIHFRAYPQKQGGVWLGKEEATEAVVSLDASYFERSVVTRIMTSACGCIREGVGCRECGNPLGTRYMPCQAAADGLFVSGSSSRPSPPSRPPRLSGPEYWAPFHSRSHTRSIPCTDSGDSPRGAFYVYTFFASQVSSEPLCHFPPPDTSRHEELIVAPPTPTRPDNGNWYGYTPSLSPRPYSPAFAPNPNPTAVPSQAETPEVFLSRRPSRRSRILDNPNDESGRGVPPALTRLDFTPPRGREDGESVREAGLAGDASAAPDADGVFVETEDILEPSSPDKNEFMAWPGR